MISIITPYYKSLEYTKRLAEVLEPQLDKDIEWIIIDDGCNETELDKLNAKVIHLKENSGGASKPRNVGIDNAKGDYIVFIDSDDLVTDDYIETIRAATRKDFDYCYYSWKSEAMTIIINDKPPKWNCCVWNCIYKKETIGNTRFREDLVIAEDYVFNQEVRKGKSRAINKVIYFYNTKNENSIMHTH